MLRGFKTRVYLTPEQENQFARAFGTRRWCYNWAIETYNRKLREDGEHLTNYQLDALLNKQRSQDTKLSWIGEVNTMIKSSALQDFFLSQKAYLKLLRKASSTAGTEVDFNALKGKPKFKGKRDYKQSFRIAAKNKGRIGEGNTFCIKSQFHMNFNWSKHYGRMTIRTRESLDFLRDAKIKTVTFSKVAGKHFMEVVYEKTNLKPHSKGSSKIGIDMGVKHVLATYDGVQGKIYDLPKNFKKFEHIIANHQAKLARKQYQSKNWWKQLRLVQNAYLRLTNARKDFLHKLTTSIASNYETIVIDDFNEKGFLSLGKNHPYANVNRSRNHKILSVSPAMLKLMLEYKASERGNSIVYIPKGTPTTQTCSHCGNKPSKRINLDIRTYKCEHCGFTEDRDVNAAINVFNYNILSSGVAGDAKACSE